MKRGAYFSDERERWQAIQQVVDSHPVLRDALERAWSGDPLRFQMRCPKGHRLEPLQLDAVEDDGRLRPMLVPVDQHAGYRDAAPTGGARGVCQRAGCPVSVPQEGYCEAHGGPVADASSLRVLLDCRRCGYGGPKRLESLLAYMVVALELGRQDISLRD